MSPVPRKAEQSLLRPTILGLMRMKWLNQMSLADVEVAWHQKHVDFAFMSPNRDIGPVAIELKVSNTSRAIDQAALNRYLTPSSWAATWTPPSEKILDKAGKHGVGILLVTPRGAYPVSFPRMGEPHTSALAEHLESRRRRVRDLLSVLRNG